MNKNIEKKLLGVLKIILISIAVIVPFVVTRDLFFPFITGKNFLFRVLVEIGVAIWLILAFQSKDYRPKKSITLYAFLAFLTVLFVANMFGENPARSFWSNFERMEGFVSLIHLFGYFLVLSSIFKTWTDWRLFLRWSVIGSFVMFLFGLTQLSCAGVNNGEVANSSKQTIDFCRNFIINQGGVRVDGTLGNAIYLAVYMLFNFFFSLLLFVKEEKKSWRVFYILSAIGAVIMIYYTATRGVMLGLFGGLGFLFVLLAFNKEVKAKIRKIALFVLIGLVVLASLFILVRNSEFIQKFPPLARLANISLESADAQARLMVWGSALKGFKEKPILGWGQENFGLVFNKYYNPHMYEREQWFDRAHNGLLDWLVAGGIFAFLLYLFLVFSAIYLIWKKKQEHENHLLSFVDKSILTSTIIAYLFQSLFVFDNITSSILLISVLALAGSLVTTTKENLFWPNFNFKLNENNRWFVIGGIGVVLLGSIYFINYKGYMTSQTLIEAIKPQKEGLDVNYNAFKKALSYNSLGKQEVREHLLQTSIGLAGNQNVSVEFKNKFVNFAIAEIINQVKETPNAIRPRFFLATSLSILGQHDLAINEFEELLKRVPQKTGVLIELATTYLRKGDNENAFMYAKKAYEGAPDLLSLRQIYVAVAVRTENFDKVKDVWDSMTDQEKVGEKIMRAFADNKQFWKIIEIIKPIYEKDKTNRTMGVSLASAYKEVGRKTQAVHIIREMIELDPSFKVQGERYIDQIRNND